MLPTSPHSCLPSTPLHLCPTPSPSINMLTNDLKPISLSRRQIPVLFLEEMELQLKLALSSNLDEGFDLNNHNEEQEYEEDYKLMKKKRCFDETFEEIKDVQVLQTLPLLDHIDICHEEDEVVGWPPINSWRKKIGHHHSRRGCTTPTNYVTVKNGGGGGDISNSMYVKVKMEGVGIARKIDLSRHHSYQTLIDTLMAMFANEKVQGYKLTYQDKEGDWLLAGDMPWGTFINSVQRLKLLRNGS